MTTPILQPQKVTQLLDSAFRLYRQNFLLFLGIIAVPLVPFILAETIIRGVFAPDVAADAAWEIPPMPTDPNDTAAMQEWMNAVSESSSADMGAIMEQAFVPMILLFVGLAVIRPIATGALTRAISERYLEREASVGGCYRYIFSILWRYLGAILAAGLVIMLPIIVASCAGAFAAAAGPAICLIVPVIIGAAVFTIMFALWFVFVSQVVVLERTGAIDALGRSRKLAKGNLLRILGMSLLILLLAAIFGWGVSFAVGLVLPYVTSTYTAQTVVSSVFSGVVDLLLSPLFAAAWILLYYDIRIRKEGFDLEMLASNLAGDAQTVPLAQPVPPPEQ
jgi:hypothetical protein